MYIGKLTNLSHPTISGEKYYIQFFLVKMKWAYKNITAGHSQMWHLNACAEGLTIF
jgi:hypothetical protein